MSDNKNSTQRIDALFGVADDDTDSGDMQEDDEHDRWSADEREEDAPEQDDDDDEDDDSGSSNSRKRRRGARDEAQAAAEAPAMTRAQYHAAATNGQRVVASASGRTLLNDVHIEQPDGQTDSMPPPHGVRSQVASDAKHSHRHYDFAQRMLAESMGPASGNDGAVGLSSPNGAVTNMAALVNHYTLTARSDAEQLRVDQTPNGKTLADLPYTVPTHGSAFGRAFYMSWLGKSPHQVRPVGENTEALRKLQSHARFVARAHIEHMTRTPRDNELACKNHEACVAREFRDHHGEPINGRPLVAFLYPDEYARFNQPGGREALNGVMSKRACVRCIIRTSNRFLSELRAQNIAIDPEQLVQAVPFYVAVERDGEYPIGATIGSGEHTFEGLLYNHPRMSLDDWEAVANPNGEQYTQYVQTSVEPYPVPREVIASYTTQGFSEAL